MPTVICIDSGQHRGRVTRRRNALIESHLYLVPPIATRIHRGLPPSFDLDDLIAEGNVGLLRAAIRYRPQQHNRTPFSAYARRKIRGAILDITRRRHYTAATHDSLDQREERGCQPLAIPNRTDAVFDEKLTHEQLQRALARLTPTQRGVLINWYTQTPSAHADAGYRRRKRVIEIHTKALETLKVEYRRAA